MWVRLMNMYMKVRLMNMYKIGQVHGVHIDTQRDDQLKSEMDTLDMPDGAGAVWFEVAF